MQESTETEGEGAGLTKASFSVLCSWKCRPLLSNFRVKLNPSGCHSGALPQGPEQWPRARVSGSPGVWVSQWDPQAIALIPWEDEVLPSRFLLEGEAAEAQLTDNSSWDRPAWERTEGAATTASSIWSTFTPIIMLTFPIHLHSQRLASSTPKPLI